MLTALPLYASASLALRFRFRDVPSEEDLESSGYGPVQDMMLPFF